MAAELVNEAFFCRRFQHDLEGVMPHILDPKQLRESVKRLYDTHCRSEPPADSMPEESPPPKTAQDLERYGLMTGILDLKH